MGMNIRFSEDVVPLSDLKANPAKVVGRVSRARRPTLLTERGRGVAVIQSVSDFEAREDERAFMKAVVAGLADLEEGREVSFSAAVRRLGIRGR